MTGFVCISVKDNCWNMYDSYGEICVGCGCCSKDKKTRYKARLELMNRRLTETQNFNDWDKDEKWRELQEKNAASDIRYYKRRIRYYEKKLKEVNE